MVAPLGVWSVQKRGGAFRTRVVGRRFPAVNIIAVVLVRDDSRHDRAQCAHLYGWTQKRARKRSYAHARAHSAPCSARHARSPHSCSRPDNVMHVVHA